MGLSRDRAARRRLALLVGAAALALAAGVVVGAGAGDEEAGRSASTARAAPERALAAVDRLSLAQQVGQLTISSFPDPTLPDYARRRLRAGRTAGVILFGRNAATRGEWRRLTGAVQSAAGGRALVMVDQEGGAVRSVAWAGPVAGQPQQGDAASVRLGARAAARQLRGAGVNVNLAPVADVPAGAAAAIGSRAFPGDAAAVAERTRVYVEGMRAGRVAATAKHFPGLGGAEANTDDAAVTLGGDPGAELAPFRAAVRARVPLVMVSHALYPTLDGRRIASQSPPVVTGLLRRRLGYRGVVITDSIEAQAVLDRSGVDRAAERSIRAGVDLILMTGSASWNEVHPWLLRRARESKALRDQIRRSAARVLALKEKLGLRVP